MTQLPIACTLTSSELQQRRATVLEKFRREITESQELDNGYAYSLSAETSVQDLATLIDLERQCCPFLRFRVDVEPAGGAIRLELTGPPGTKEFLAALFV